MSWLVFSFAATLLWSICNFIDKILIDRFVPEKSTAIAFSVYTSIFSFLLLPFVLYFNLHALTVEPLHAVMFMGAGCLEIIALSLYFRALQHEDTSTVVPFLQAIPVFSFILGFFLLDETLSSIQIYSGIGIIMGGVLLSFETAKGAKRRFRLPLIILMLGAALCYALFDAIFKFTALREDFWTGVVWQHAGIVLTGVLLFIFHKKYRKRSISIVKSGGHSVFSLNLFNESLYAIGVMLANYALLLAPIALVGLVNVYHPVLVFVIGITLTVFAPRILKEEFSRKDIFLKTVGIAVILISSIFLFTHS